MQLLGRTTGGERTGDLAPSLSSEIVEPQMSESAITLLYIAHFTVTDRVTGCPLKCFRADAFSTISSTISSPEPLMEDVCSCCGIWHDTKATRLHSVAMLIQTSVTTSGVNVVAVHC